MNKKYLNINEIQDQIIRDFDIFENDIEQMLEYLMDLGDELYILDEKYKIEENEIKGCLSKAWLIVERKNNKLFFKADTNTKITKGLISLLIKIFSGQNIEDILNANLYFMEKIGLKNMIGSKRISGYSNMLNQIISYAKKFNKTNTLLDRYQNVVK